MLITNKKDLLDKLNFISDNLYIVGAGKFGNILGLWLNQNDINWKGYIDQKKCGQLNGKAITKSWITGGNCYFLISSYIHRKELEENLSLQGISENYILSPSNNEVLYDLYEEVSKWRKYVKRNERFNGCHKESERCFIIGNGPSLRIKDVELLKNEITFASNSIYALYEKTDWRPTYYCAWDPSFCEAMMNSKESVENLINGCACAFTSVIGNGFQFRDEETLQKLYYVNSVQEIDNNTGLPLFSTDCSEIVYTSGTITYCMLQLAVYMGFKEIYLLGMDCVFSHERYKDGTIKINNVNNHSNEIEIFCGIDENEKKTVGIIEKTYGFKYLADVDLQIAGYKAAKQHSERNGIKIYNATRGGKLEVFERVDIDSLFK